MRRVRGTTSRPTRRENPPGQLTPRPVRAHPAPPRPLIPPLPTPPAPHTQPVLSSRPVRSPAEPPNQVHNSHEASRERRTKGNARRSLLPAARKRPRKCFFFKLRLLAVFKPEIGTSKTQLKRKGGRLGSPSCGSQEPERGQEVAPLRAPHALSPGRAAPASGFPSCVLPCFCRADQTGTLSFAAHRNRASRELSPSSRNSLQPLALMSHMQARSLRRDPGN